MGYWKCLAEIPFVIGDGRSGIDTCALPRGHAGPHSTQPLIQEEHESLGDETGGEDMSQYTGMRLDALTAADLLFLIQRGTCIDSADGLSLTSATEPLREALIELDRLRRWRVAVRESIHSGATGFEALDNANSEMIGEKARET